jgi:hypothetical protein
MFKLNLASVRIDPDVSAGQLADLSEGYFRQPLSMAYALILFCPALQRSLFPFCVCMFVCVCMCACEVEYICGMCISVGELA